MGDNQHGRLSLKKHWEQFKAHHRAWYNGRLKEFISSHPLHGRIVNATEWKILFASLIIYFGATLLLVFMMVDLENRGVWFLIFYAFVRWGAPAVHFGVSSYMLRHKDRMASYAKFNEWLQARA